MNSAPCVQRPVIVIAGPTASGKSDVAMELAKIMSIEIVCADARTVFAGLDIGTAKPSAVDRQRVRHHCVDIVAADQSFTASDFASAARRAIDAMPDSVTPVVVGGSGLYITALIDGFSEGVAVADDDIREQLARELEECGREHMFAVLESIDPRAARMYADKNPRRVLRALEYYRATGKTFSSTWDTPRSASHYNTLMFGVHRDRDVLRDRIAARCAEMWNRGLLNETRDLLEHGIAETAQSLSSIGYSQAIDVLRGRCTLEKAQYSLLQATWQYAKRQLTWFKKDQRFMWLSGTEAASAADIKRIHHERLLTKDA